MPMMKPRASRLGAGSGAGRGAASDGGISMASGGMGNSGDIMRGGGGGSSKSDGGITMSTSGSGGQMSGSSMNGSMPASGSGSQRGSAAAQAQAQQQQLAASAQARKRRSSINVYDQPSSLNSRLRQLETDMLRLDEDRTKLFDDTHSALTQYEIKLGEIHAILKSRQDNVEKYVEEMKMLLQAKEDFEKQTKMLNEKHDRIHEKFMHRETIISREIKLLKNKFELLEKNRQFKSLLSQKSSPSGGDTTNNRDDSDLTSGLIEGSGGDSLMSLARKRSETGTTLTMNTSGDDEGPGGQFSDSIKRSASGALGGGRKNVRIKLSKFSSIGHLFSPLFSLGQTPVKRRAASQKRRKSNKVSSIMMSKNELDSGCADSAGELGAKTAATTNEADQIIGNNSVSNANIEALTNSTGATNAGGGKSIKRSLMSRLFG